MRIISWNMQAGFGYEAARHDQAWEYLRDLDPDVALLQEAVPPAWAADQWLGLVAHRSYPAHPDRADVAWGSAVVSRAGAIEPFSLDDAYPWLGELWGSTVVARLQSDDPVWFASIHSNAYPVPTDRLEKHSIEGFRRCHETKIWQVELAAAELERLFHGSRFVVGGDLNSALLFDANNHYDNNARLFRNLAEAGFCDLRRPFFETEQQTYFKSGKAPYQLDHVFSDSASSKCARSWRVLPEPAQDGLSDHAPIEIVVVD